ncbi:MAG: hypothetical protein IPO41_13140 [Acidobacteria bacterium]|nr:hypothetical protein [Acidobacteriota bacterium]
MIPRTVTSPKIPTLVLFDVSGSMADNDKIGQARSAGLTLLEMKGAASAPRDNDVFG